MGEPGEKSGEKGRGREWFPGAFLCIQQCNSLCSSYGKKTSIYGHALKVCWGPTGTGGP